MDKDWKTFTKKIILLEENLELENVDVEQIEKKAESENEANSEAVISATESEENNNLIGLESNGKQVTLEPGNQIELAGAKLSNIHETCSESFEFQDQLINASNHLGLQLFSVGYDPFTKLDNVPTNPKKRYQVMTKEMPKNNNLSLEMMYQTAGTQINLDYISENDFIKKFKLIASLTPISIGIFANSPVKEKKLTKISKFQKCQIWHENQKPYHNQISFCLK